MRRQNWLACLSRRLQRFVGDLRRADNSCRPRPERSTARTAEVLETRTLLSVAAFFFSFDGSLNIDVSAGSGVRVSASGGAVVVEEELPDGTFAPVAITGAPSGPSAVQRINVVGDGSDNRVDLSLVSQADYSSLTAIVADTGDGDDTILGSGDLADSLIGGDGHDVLVGNGGDDTLDGGDGNDALTGGDGNDSLLAGDGFDTASGGDGDDTVSGGDSGDLITGDAGNDVLTGGDGEDTIDGGDGDDAATGDFGDDSMTGGAGNDTIAGNLGDDTVSGGDDNDSIEGQAGNDQLLGDAGDDTVLGHSGDDSVEGGDGNDRLIGNAGTDTVRGGDGDDLIFGGSHDDFLVGRDGDDTINGQGGNDTILGGQGADFIRGHGNDDQIIGDPVLVSIDSVTMDEGDGSPNVFFVFTVTLSESSDVPIDVDYATSDGTATAGSDYVAAAGTLRFDPGVTVQTISIEIIGDTVIEPDETFFVTLTVANSDFVSVLAGTGQGTIVDDDNPGPANVGLNFTGTTYNQSFYIPPDTQGAVGPNHIVEMVNGRYAVYDKTTGTQLAASSFSQFWTDAGATFVGSPFDPRVVYDPDSGRWFAAAADNAFQANNFLLAVSNSSDPTAGWTGFAIDSDTDNAQWADFPMLGIDADAVYLSANMFGIGPNDPFEINLLVVPKADLVAPTPTVANATLIENLPVPGGFTFQPAVDFGPSDGRAPLISASVSGELWRMDILNPGSGSPTVSSTVTISVPPYGLTMDADQPGSKQNLESGTASVSAYVYEQGDSLWVVHSVDDSATGNVAIRWYEIDEPTNTVLQTGLIADPDLDLIYPSIAANANGEVVIGVTGTSENVFPSTYAIVGTTTGGVTSFGPPILLQAGVSDYERLDGFGRNRWGDYSATVVDPVDPGVFWTFQEFVDATDSWAVQITQIIPGPMAPPPPPPPPAPSASADTIFGGSGNDTINGNAGNDRINGDSGDDLIDGGTDDDELFGGAGRDTLFGGDGDDTLWGLGDPDTVDGGAGNDQYVWNQHGNDLFQNTGGGGDLVQILTGDGDDTPTVQAGNGGLQFLVGSETLTVDPSLVQVELDLGNGNDHVTIRNTSGIGAMLLMINGEDGNDTVDATNASLGFVHLLADGGAGNDTLLGSRDRDTLLGGDGDDSIFGDRGRDLLDGGLGHDSIDGGLGDDTLRGGDGNDTLQGLWGDDVLYGDAGDDLLDGHRNDDTLYGGDGNDKLIGRQDDDSMLGEAGDDSLFGGGGDDWMDGGVGDDTLRGHDGNDRMRGDDGNDTLVGDNGNDTLIGNDGNDTLKGNNGDDLIGGEDGADVLVGHAGNDTIAGGDNDDKLYGGSGNDVVLGEDGDDTVNGQGGSDTVAGGQGTNVI
ncbi:MAG: hypothetical protein D6725_10320, partial [Planctomycetota bacterium]